MKRKLTEKRICKKLKEPEEENNILKQNHGKAKITINMQNGKILYNEHTENMTLFDLSLLIAEFHRIANHFQQRYDDTSELELEGDGTEAFS